MIESSPNQRPSGLVTLENLEKMGTELVALCDGIERHGLVDYQYGVWEEKILQSAWHPNPFRFACCRTNHPAVLGECMDLEGDAEDKSGTNALGSSHYH